MVDNQLLPLCQEARKKNSSKKYRKAFIESQLNPYSPPTDKSDKYYLDTDTMLLIVFVLFQVYVLIWSCIANIAHLYITFLDPFPIIDWIINNL